MNFYTGKKVLITGNTGFKGSWMTEVLLMAGAEVYGYSLKPPTNPSLFELLELEKQIHQEYGDVRDFEQLRRYFQSVNPEIVFHLAAQPIVSESYQNPMYTYETNVMGTVSILECLRRSSRVKSFLNITTDKVYENREWIWGYRENDPLGGFDPYSNSKSCSELVTQSYRQSFLHQREIAVSTARAGNVIGFGDFAPDRILPDCFRAIQSGESLTLRNPNAVRPYQHVLEAISAYLTIARQQYEKPEKADCYNVGPESKDCITTKTLIELLQEAWQAPIPFQTKETETFHESGFLRLDSSKLQRKLGWNPKWSIQTAVRKTADGMKKYMENKPAKEEIRNEISAYFDGDFKAGPCGSEKNERQSTGRG